MIKLFLNNVINIFKDNSIIVDWKFIKLSEEVDVDKLLLFFVSGKDILVMIEKVIRILFLFIF